MSAPGRSRSGADRPLPAIASSTSAGWGTPDVGLPGGMNGRQMADAARSSRPDFNVPVITDYTENAMVGHGHLDPGMHVITKPFALDALASRIKDITGSR